MHDSLHSVSFLEMFHVCGKEGLVCNGQGANHCEGVRGGGAERGPWGSPLAEPALPLCAGARAPQPAQGAPASMTSLLSFLGADVVRRVPLLPRVWNLLPRAPTAGTERGKTNLSARRSGPMWHPREHASGLWPRGRPVPARRPPGRSRAGDPQAPRCLTQVCGGNPQVSELQPRSGEGAKAGSRVGLF